MQCVAFAHGSDAAQATGLGRSRGVVSSVSPELPALDGGRGAWGERSKGKRPRGWKEAGAGDAPGRWWLLWAALRVCLGLSYSLSASGHAAFHTSVLVWRGPGSGGRGSANSESGQCSCQEARGVWIFLDNPLGKAKRLGISPWGTAGDMALMSFRAGATQPHNRDWDLARQHLHWALDLSQGG